MTDRVEYSVGTAEWRGRIGGSIPHSAFRIPHCVAGVGNCALLAFLTIMFAPATVMACPGCKEALFDPGTLPQKLATAKGYALSIGFMLAMPLLLIGSVGVLIVRAHRRKRRTTWIRDSLRDVP